MAKYRVRVKHGKNGAMNSVATVDVEASSESVAMELAVNKFKTSNAAYRDHDAVPVEVKEI